MSERVHSGTKVTGPRGRATVQRDGQAPRMPRTGRTAHGHALSGPFVSPVAPNPYRTAVVAGTASMTRVLKFARHSVSSLAVCYRRLNYRPTRRANRPGTEFLKLAFCYFENSLEKLMPTVPQASCSSCSARSLGRRKSIENRTPSTTACSCRSRKSACDLPSSSDARSRSRISISSSSIMLVQNS